MSTVDCFKLLSPEIKKWIYKKGWQDLLPIQKQSIEPVLKQDRDIIISASTASGKTEAAFLPALSAISRMHDKTGVMILYISPLKALINDQFRRLSEISQFTSIAITPWHGDVSVNTKNKLLQNPSGVMLTTPESLESLLINHVSWIKNSMRNLTYTVIDEFHAFMGMQRGYQLQSQLHRLENLIGRNVVRIALSATFSNANAAMAYIRPNSNIPCQVIQNPTSNQDRLCVQLRGYEHTEDGESLEKKLPQEFNLIANDLFRLLRGGTNLVFCNSRFCTEALAAKLQELSAKNFVPNEFFPHHGSLSKDLRESLEYRLQEGRWPTTAVCTATLELGIDISEVNSIAQVDPPLTVASLRQRLGRAGRRDHKAVLRLFIPESGNGLNSNKTELFENTVMTAAMVNLLLKRWYEPPLKSEYAFSTMLQQTLSVIASFGSASAKSLYELLCKTGNFNLCDAKLFMRFLKDLGRSDLIAQLGDGSLSLGVEGEKLVSNWSFYAAFDTPKEYSIENDGKRIGTVPLSQPLSIDDTFLFAGRGWKVNFFSEEKALIGVKLYPHEAQPLNISGTLGHIHDEVRREMFRVYNSAQLPAFVNKTARNHCIKGFELFKKYDLANKKIVSGPGGLALFPWRSDKVLRTIILLLKKESVKASQYKSHIELEYTPVDSLKTAVQKILCAESFNPIELISGIKNLDIHKHDKYIGEDLKRISYAYSTLDLTGALEFFKELQRDL